MLEIVANYNCMQFQGELMNQNWEYGKKPNFGFDFASFDPNWQPKILWVLSLLDIRHCCKPSLYVFQGKLMIQSQENGIILTVRADYVNFTCQTLGFCSIYLLVMHINNNPSLAWQTLRFCVF